MATDNVIARPDCEMPGAATLEVHDLTAGYGALTVFSGATLSVNRGATLVVLGDSGCGKSTLLKAIAGLIPVSSGRIALGSRPVHDLPPGQRGIIYLDQEPLLFEHLSVAENIGFALRLQRVSETAIDRAVSDMLTAIDLVSHGHKRDSQLSGGQKQRVAFARAILARPRLLLLDEPFSNLDTRSRGQMQSLFKELSGQFALTSILVTHDVKEALVIGDQFARLEKCRLRHYPDRHAFAADETTGITAEIEFWRNQADAS